MQKRRGRGEISSKGKTLTFQKRSTPAKEIKSHSLALVRPQQVPSIHTPLVAPVVLCKKVLKLLRAEPALVVEAHRVGAVLVLVQVGNVDAEEGIGDPVGRRWIAEVEVDDKCCEQAERQGPAPGAETAVRVLRPDDAIAIAIPVFGVLLDYLQGGKKINNPTRQLLLAPSYPWLLRTVSWL